MVALRPDRPRQRAAEVLSRREACEHAAQPDVLVFRGDFPKRLDGSLWQREGSVGLTYRW